MDEALGPSAAWDHSQVDFGLAEGGGGGGEDDVAHEGEFAASAELGRWSQRSARDAQMMDEIEQDLLHNH